MFPTRPSRSGLRKAINQREGIWPPPGNDFKDCWSRHEEERKKTEMMAMKKTAK
jgi:hypothetical protein